MSCAGFEGKCGQSLVSFQSVKEGKTRIDQFGSCYSVDLILQEHLLENGRKEY